MNYETLKLQACLTIKNNKFTGIVFNDKTFEYDGMTHNIYCENVPEFASVSYIGNNISQDGEHVVTAIIQADNYETLTLTSKLTITIKVFENLKFNDLTCNYDGLIHTIEVENLPSFATVSYKNNSVTNVGTYNAQAIIKAVGYKTLTLNACIKIEPLQFNGITFEDELINYDGYYHSIYVKGIPSDANIKYTGNNKCEIGEYTVTAKITCTGYQTLTLSAKMKIGKFFSDINFPNRTLIYDGTSQKIDVNLNDLPRYTNVTYQINNQTVNDFSVKNIGSYNVSIILTNDEYKYTPRTFNAVVKVINQDIGGVDKTKQAYQITNNIKYQDLFNQILNKNYTISCVVSDDYFYPDGSTASKISSTTITYVDNDEMFKYYDLYDKSSNSYNLAETEITHIKIVNDEVLKVTYSNGIISELIKTNKENYDENYAVREGIVILSYLTSGENGEILNSSVGGYTTTYGTFIIDETNNTFTMETRNHYYHPEWDHDEVVTYTIYNIGNTKIDMIDDYNAENCNYNAFEELNPVIIDGISYYSSRANITIDAVDYTLVTKKIIILQPIVSGNIINELGYEYYDKYYNLDLTGYTICVYFDSNGYYQGEYSDYGFVKNYKDLKNHFESYGGTIKYYGQW